MGRIRIKKKNAVLPFRETVAYRLLMAGAGIVVALISLFGVMNFLASDNMRGLVAAGVLTLVGGTFAVYNLSQTRTAKIPRSALQRMKRR